MVKKLKSNIVAASLLLALTASALPAHAEWLKAESEHFVIYGDTSESAIRNYTRKVERFDSMLRVFFPISSDIEVPPLAIYLADGRKDMRQIWPDISPDVGGFYTPGNERIFAVTGGSGVDNDNTLFHEYAHHFMYQYLPGAYPGWFVEGFAEFFATADLTPNRMRVGLHSAGRMNSLTQGENSWLPMEAVLRSRSAEVRGRGRGHYYYAQSWALTHYFMSTPERTAALGRYLAAVMEGGDPITSLQPATGFTPAQLQREVQVYLGRINYLPQSRDFPPAEVTVSRLPSSARDVIWLDLRLARFVPEAARAGNLVEAQQAASRYPDDPWAARVLAQAYLDMKQPDRAVAVMDVSLEHQPDDPQTLRMKAISLMDMADMLEDEPEQKTQLYRQARSSLARAYQLDAHDYRLYLALDRSRQNAADYPSDNDLDTILMARALAPQVSDAGVKSATALMHHGLYANAAAILAPIANNPHGGSGLAPIRRLLAEARRKSGMTAQSDAELTADDAAEQGEDTGGEGD